MGTKRKLKTGTDILMTALLILLIAYQITGQRLHEWFGAAMSALFVAYTFFNIRWYGRLFKGKYTPFRIFRTVINLAVLAAILCLGFSGIVMSRHVFAFLPVGCGWHGLRRLHLPYMGYIVL